MARLATYRATGLLIVPYCHVESLNPFVILMNLLADPDFGVRPTQLCTQHMNDREALLNQAQTQPGGKRSRANEPDADPDGNPGKPENLKTMLLTMEKDDHGAFVAILVEFSNKCLCQTFIYILRLRLRIQIQTLTRLDRTTRARY